MSILVDISGLLHKSVFNAVKSIPPQKDIIHVDMYKRAFIDNIINELVELELEHKSSFGELIICFDYKGKDSYWRKDIHSVYKGQRKVTKEKARFDYNDVYTLFDELKEQLQENTPWKCVTVNRAEADDTILILARELGRTQKILIYSADKDMIQAQFNNPKVKQYSHQTKKWLLPEDKYDNMEHWLFEHQCFGDVSDNVFNIVHHSEFSDNFKKYLTQNKIDSEYHSVKKFKELDIDTKRELLSNFNVFKKPKKNEIEPVLDVYKDIRFGPSGLAKKIKEFGSFEKYLDSNPILRENFELNGILVREDGIPDYIVKDTIQTYKEARTVYNRDVFIKYLEDLGLYSCISDVQKIFKSDEELSIDNCGW